MKRLQILALMLVAAGPALSQSNATHVGGPPAGSVSGSPPPVSGVLPLPVEDELAILRLASRYWWAVDTNDPDAFVSTIAEDGTFVHPTRTSQGHTAIRDWLAWSAENRRGPSGRLSTRHHSVNHMIRMTGPDSAEMSSYLIVVRTEGLGAMEPPYITSHGVLKDRLRRVDGEWRFVRREQSDQVLMRRDVEMQN